MANAGQVERGYFWSKREITCEWQNYYSVIDRSAPANNWFLIRLLDQQFHVDLSYRNCVSQPTSWKTDFIILVKESISREKITKFSGKEAFPFFQDPLHRAMPQFENISKSVNILASVNFMKKCHLAKKTTIYSGEISNIFFLCRMLPKLGLSSIIRVMKKGEAPLP